MKAIIAGSRHINNKELVFEILDSLDFEITEVVSGGARGIDSIGESWASANEIKITRFLPDWEKNGKPAGHIRNKQMANYVGEDGALVLIWDGKSKGSANMSKTAKLVGMKVIEYVI